MTPNAQEQRAHAEIIDAATDLRELGSALTDASRRLVRASSVCFLPFGRDVSSMSDATLFHEQHSREHLLAAILDILPVQQRELGSGGKVATERLFGLRKTAVDLNAFFGPEGLERTQSFNEFWRPCHIERQLFAPLAEGAQPIGYLCMGRAASEPAFRDVDLRHADWLNRQALTALQRLGKAGSDPAWAVLDALRGIPLPCALFDASGRLLWISSAAEKPLQLRLVGLGSTQLVAPTANLLEWHAAARRAFASQSSTTRDGDLSLQRLSNELGPLMLVTQNPSDRQHPERADRLRSRWRLTTRETEVLIELASGRSNKEIAVSLGCSPRTVDVHVSSLLLKSGCTTRTELLARLWSSS